MIIGSQLFRAQESSNTMAWAKEHIDDAQDGAVFLADILTRASGRDGRTWQWYPGQLAVTLLLKPSNLSKIHREDLSMRFNQLNMALILGLLEPLGGYGVALKWPNDLVFGDKKVGGMLMQLVWQDNWPKGVIVGFAVNINNIFDETDPLYPIATSLKMISKQDLNMRDMYKKMLASIDQWYEWWRLGKFDMIYKEWRKAQQYLGKTLTVHQKDGAVITGKFLQALPQGDIILEKAEGLQQIIPFCVVQEVKII